MRVVAATLVALGSVVIFVGLGGAESSGVSARTEPERIAFAQGWVSFRGDESFQIWTMNPDGTRKRQLTRQGGRDPAWSPDGRRLAYVRFIPGGRGFNTTIYVMNADGSGQRRLLRGPASSYIASPTWSPDGREIAFVRDMGITNGEIWVMNADGTHQRRLTRNAASDYAPDWSPDGNRIVFERGTVTKVRSG